MVEIKQRLDNDDHYNGGNTKEYIVVHDTGNNTDSAEGNANYFCTGSRNASAHYFVDDDSITQLVLDNDCSWHVGDGQGKYGITNRNSIGIEQCRVNGVVTEKTMHNTLELIVILIKKYGIPEEKVVRHYDASRKNCPASFNSDGKWTRWFAFKANLHELLNPVQEMFRVRLSFEDVKSQKGAYRDLENAKVCANQNAGYKVFNSKGEVVYPLSQSQPIPTPVAQLKPIEQLKPVEKKTYEYYIVQQISGELQSAINTVYGTHIDVDNYLGDQTFEAIKNHHVCVKAKQNNVLVKVIQKRLVQLGYALPKYGVDGSISSGGETEKVIKKFQSNRGLVADGQAGINTIKQLFKR